jgi:hypothetical protein
VIKAELTHDRKAARCPSCHRLLAWRVRQRDGSHVVVIDRGWRKPPGRWWSDDLAASRWWRDWERHESGRSLREARAPAPSRDAKCGGHPYGDHVMHLPAILACAPSCGNEVELDPAVLDVLPHWPDLVNNLFVWPPGTGPHRLARRGPSR